MPFNYTFTYVFSCPHTVNIEKDILLYESKHVPLFVWDSFVSSFGKMKGLTWLIHWGTKKYCIG